jgi:hypothetical protein
MNTTIEIVEIYGSDISSRARAALLRKEVINATADGTIVDLHFDGVRTISESFADELFGVLVQEKGADWFRSFVRVRNIEPLPRATVLEAVAERLERTTA